MSRALSGLRITRLALLVGCILLFTTLLVRAAPPPRVANSITLAGNLQDEISSCGEWTPDCAETHLTLIGNQVWRGAFTVPAGDYEYKMVVDDAWENGAYAGNHQINGNTTLGVSAEQEVIFYFDEKTNAVLDSVMDSIAVVTGEVQSEIGCPGDWQPDCVQSLMNDVGGDGEYTLITTALTAGDYEYKVAFNEGWGNGEVPANNAVCTVANDNDVVTFSWTEGSDPFCTSEAPPDSVALVGDLQSELGCSSDWQPECADTEMALTVNHVYRGEFSIPDGSYEYKVALNDTWDESYPAGNLSLVVPPVRDTDVRFYFDQKTSAVMDNVNTPKIPVVAGQIQSEVGCSDDWQPSCLGSLMTDGDGDGIFTFSTSALIAGDYEFKVAFNEDWGNGEVPDNNVVCTVPSDNVAMTFSWNSADDSVSCTAPSSGGNFDPSVTAARINYDAQNEVFYFVLTDRFSDGDSNNNEGANPGGTFAETGYDKSDKAFYHGGDFAGMEAQLDYLEGLGITAIWITPPYVNQTTQPDSSADKGIGAAYHGYWILDYENADPHLGTNTELISLIDAAHDRDIKVYFDMVVNHTADVIDYEGDSNAYISKEDTPYKDADGNEFDDRDFAGGDTFPPLDPAVSFPYVPEIPEGMENAKVPAWLNNPIYYHNRGDTSFTGENSLYGDFFGLDDTFTEHPDVVNGYIDIVKNLIDVYDIDGLRLDTVKHVNLELWQQFTPEIMQYAADNGKPDFYMYGEVFDSSPINMSQFTTAGSLPSVADFGFQSSTRSFVAGGSDTDALRDFFAQDDYYTDANSNAYGLGTFVSNHDGGVERIGSYLSGTDAEKLARASLAHGLMFTARGFPIVYYGDEQGFVGGGSDKNAREDMMPSEVAEFNNYNLIGTDATVADDNFDITHPLYQLINDLSFVRENASAFRVGTQIHRYSTDSAGVYAFSRIDRADRMEYVVALNNSDTAQTVEIPTYTPNANFYAWYINGLLPGSGPEPTDENGNFTITVPAYTASIYFSDAAVPCGDMAPNVTISVPETLTGRAEIGATLDADAFAELTFAVSEDDGENWTIIGTDDNAPYRVFFDVSNYADETELKFQVVVDDLCGNEVTGDAATGIVSIEDPVDGDKPKYAIVHYYREDGDYGDFDSTDYNDFWGLHLWDASGGAFDAEHPDNRPMGNQLEWTNGKRVWGQDEYGQFAWIALSASGEDSAEIGIIIHRGDTKDGTDSDRFFQPYVNTEIWLRQDDPNIYTSEADARGGTVTFHYQRDDGDYGDYNSDDFNDFWGLHLWQDSWTTQWDAPFKAAGTNDYGAYFDIDEAALEALIGDDITLDLSQPLNYIVHRGNDKDVDPDRFHLFPATNSHAWLLNGVEELYPSQAMAEGKAVIHYRRSAGDYGDYGSMDFNDFWGMHVWTGAVDPNPGWTDPVRPVYTDTFGIVFEVAVDQSAGQLSYILHRGDEKDPGPDQALIFAEFGNEVWQLQGADPLCPYVYPAADGSPAAPNIGKQRAHWVNMNTIVWPDATNSSLDYTILSSLDAQLEATPNGITGGESMTLTGAGGYDPADNNGWFPHLAGMPTFTIEGIDRETATAMLKGQLAVQGMGSEFAEVGTSIQIPGVLDDMFFTDEALGINWSDTNRAVPTISVWAPTAQSVKLHVFDDADPATTSTAYDMTWDSATGVWSHTGQDGWKGKYYLFEVVVFAPTTGQIETNMVTDPYAVSLSMNSQRSQMVDLSDDDLKPDGWDGLDKPNNFDVPEEISVYEIHIRDFSILDETIPEADRGKYTAFNYPDSDGMKHITRLAEDGLTHLHLLPVFDIATINEDPTQRQEPDYDIMATYAPTSTQQQATIAAIADQDGFNWGYDPYHYTTPEGSYSTDANGTQRILEFRQMVQSLNGAGLNVVMDVVYNHTNAAGQSEKSVLDRVVPGYYHRLNEDGGVETSTCCQNTASEHLMMEKLMVDSLVVWAVEYKVDSFRFDLMGHHMKSNMLKVQETLAALDETADGVDGSRIYIYGEGWNFGEVANNARGIHATQFNMAGTGIGTFSDRLRDAVRGPGPFNGGNDLKTQGFINGQFYDPNDHPVATDLARLLLQADQIRVGLAGNLADFTFVDRNGNVVSGSEVDYNGSPAGYTQDPQENVTYVSKHDNQTLFDINAYTMPQDSTLAERVRVQNLGLGIVAFGQGMHFFHAGSDILRSKSMDRDSYNSGDWFNRLDWTYQTNNFAVGMPMQSVNGDNYFIIEPILANGLISPDEAAIMFNHAVFQEYLAIRSGSLLFSLQTEEAVQNQLKFHNTGVDQIPGLIAMSLHEAGSPDQPSYIVFFNANDETQTLTIDEVGAFVYNLHEVQANGVDEVVKTAKWSEVSNGNRVAGQFEIPARTTAVFVADLDPMAINVQTVSSNVNGANVMWLVVLPLMGMGALAAYRLRREEQ